MNRQFKRSVNSLVIVLGEIAKKKAEEARKAEEKRGAEAERVQSAEKKTAEARDGLSFGNQKAFQAFQAELADKFRQLALSGDAEAQYQYALCLHYGQGVRPNETAAMGWMEKAARAGHAKAREMLQKKQETNQTAEHARKAEEDRKAEEAHYQYIIKNDGTAEITGYDDKQKRAVTIPDRLNGHKVTSIGVRAFWKCGSMTGVTIPFGVTSIGKDAFWHCSGLTSVAIPSSVTSIGDYAFLNCTGLTNVTIPPSITSIGEGAFAGCIGLISVTVLSRAASIGACAFYGCSSLSIVTIPSSVTHIGGRAFQGCSKLSGVARVRETWKKDSLCQYCGGEFNLINRCKSCRRWKDY